MNTIILTLQTSKTADPVKKTGIAIGNLEISGIIKKTKEYLHQIINDLIVISVNIVKQKMVIEETG